MNGAPSEGQITPESLGLQSALGRALKFTAADLEANRAGRLGLNQRLRLLARGILLIGFVAAVAIVTGFGYVRIQRLDANAWQLFLLPVTIEFLAFLVVASRGARMLFDVARPTVIRRVGKLTFGDTLQPKCSANFIDDAFKAPDRFSLPSLLYEGAEAYLIDWTREPDDIGIRLPCDVVGPKPQDRRCISYCCRWSRRPLAIELESAALARSRHPRRAGRV